MSTIKAVVVVGDTKHAEITDVPVPKIRDDCLLIETKAVALNPADWKIVDWGITNLGSKIGTEGAGVVVETGKNATEFKNGDHVAFMTHGGHLTDHESGAFTERVLAKASTAFKIPDGMDFPQAASVPAGMYSAGILIHNKLGLPLPAEPAKTPAAILIHGGSSNTGMWAIQSAKAAGCTVIATASPRNFEMLKSLGADEVLDYHSLTCGSDIRALTANKMRHAVDCVGGGEVICGEALSDAEPSELQTTGPVQVEVLKKTNPLVTPDHTLNALIALGESFELFGEPVPVDPEIVEFAVAFKKIVADGLQAGTFKPVRLVLNRGGDGLEGVMKGMDEGRQGNYSGEKFVYTFG